MKRKAKRGSAKLLSPLFNVVGHMGMPPPFNLYLQNHMEAGIIKDPLLRLCFKFEAPSIPFSPYAIYRKPKTHATNYLPRCFPFPRSSSPINQRAPRGRRASNSHPMLQPLPHKGRIRTVKEKVVMRFHTPMAQDTCQRALSKSKDTIMGRQFFKDSEPCNKTMTWNVTRKPNKPMPRNLGPMIPKEIPCICKGKLAIR